MGRDSSAARCSNAAARTGGASRWTDTDDDAEHARAWILAHASEGMFTATTELGTGVGFGSSDDRDTGVAMLVGASLITRRPDSPAAMNLRALLARWRKAGAPRIEQIDVTVNLEPLVLELQQVLRSFPAGTRLVLHARQRSDYLLAVLAGGASGRPNWSRAAELSAARGLTRRHVEHALTAAGHTIATNATGRRGAWKRATTSSYLLRIGRGV